MPIAALGLLLFCQLVGETVVRVLVLPLPGPVLGLLLLLILLGVWHRLGRMPGGVEQTPLGRAAHGLLSSLSLLFIPVGVGVTEHLHLLGEHGLALIVVLAGSTIVTMVATVGTFLAVRRLMAGRRA